MILFGHNHLSPEYNTNNEASRNIRQNQKHLSGTSNSSYKTNMLGNDIW